MVLRAPCIAMNARKRVVIASLFNWVSKLMACRGLISMLELILIMDRLWKKLGIRDKVRLQLEFPWAPLRTAGLPGNFNQLFQEHLDELDEDSLRRLETNPLGFWTPKPGHATGFVAMLPN